MHFALPANYNICCDLHIFKEKFAVEAGLYVDLFAIAPVAPASGLWSVFIVCVQRGRGRWICVHIAR